ncbi:carbohydrate ABC transporter membrane protein 1 (CUT1 family) [Streptohalobacillus salinus]|uniref:Carbohydrate ABC transporter membrane protein 1 (CUT1 family) n=1 Tax=Streptohalobacillus salinus TaxID=621096 RepID=A0A2V3WS39_9BACI|nr:ABC transporter permease subunit [Streptohalobacillus salinus]PXW91499.1 carbohydrate ABC transporter membrane protein 1 (CUT1 family) [Streptohalobacillus salinus]
MSKNLTPVTPRGAPLVRGNKSHKNTYAPRKKSFWKRLMNQKALLLMSLPFVIWLIVFRYIPVLGWIMAFQDYKPQNGFLGNEWVGLKHFRDLFNEPIFYRALENTIGMGLLGLVFGTISAILFALMLNEMRFIRFKKITQTISYLPHFVSWVIVANIVTTMLSLEGPINDLLTSLGIFDGPLNFMAQPNLFWGIVTSAEVWKSTGWNAIIYFAAMAGIDPQLYEAAKVDGASRVRQMWHITLPSIRAVIIVLLILSIGNLINIGFEKQMLLGNNIVTDKAIVIDLYALNYGIGMFRYSFGTAIGIFKSVVSVILILIANGFAKRIGEGRVF